MNITINTKTMDFCEKTFSPILKANVDVNLPVELLQDLRVGAGKFNGPTHEEALNKLKMELGEELLKAIT